MANPTVAEVAAVKPLLTGGVSVADSGTTLPTDAVTALDAAFVGLGYISEDGVVPSTDTTTDSKKAWGGDVVLVAQTDYSRTYEISFLQVASKDVLGLIFGDANVTETAASVDHGKQIKYLDKGEVRPHKVFSIDGMKGDARFREVLEDGQVVSVEEGPWVDSDLRYYKATVQAFRGASTQAFMVGYTDDGQKTEA